MKSYTFCLLFILLFMVACAADPQLRLPEMTAAEERQGKDACADVFPQKNGGKWQFVHSIDFTMKDGSGTTVVGVTTLDKNDIECALVTVEGLTLFEAAFRHDNSFEIRRAIPPFDKPEFAKGLINDIRAIFQPPQGTKMQTGHLAGAASVCRYIEVDGSVVDVLPDIDGCLQIKSYNPDLILERSITGRSCREIGSSPIPDYIELKTFGRTGYTLKMTLISIDNFK
jgi:hypothetical protein